MKLNDIPKLMPVPFGVGGPRTELLPSSPAGDRKASYKDGFPPITMLLKSAGGLPPDGGNMNQILFELASGQRWSNAGAGYKFNATFSDAVGGYPKGAQLLSNDGTKVYVSTKDDNKTDFNTSPGTDWVTLGNYIGLGEYAKAEDLHKYLAKDQNGADIQDKDAFIKNLGLPEKYFPLSGGTVSGEVKTEKRLIVENKNGFSGIELIGLAGTVVIETDAAGSGYIVIRDKSGKNIGSVTLSTLTDVNSFIYPGKIEWCSLPLSEIRPHCYHANGDKYPLTSDVGKALRSLSQGYKAAHGIVESDGMINMPNVYHSDGRGYFFRANQLGLKQEDISRRIYGAIGIEKGIELPTSYGAFTQNFVDIDSASHTGVSRSSKGTWNFDSSNVTPTGNENRPISYGLIPIVYLGV